MSRKRSFAAFGVALSLCMAAHAQERSMGVRQKPDAVLHERLPRSDGRQASRVRSG
jgi:hypothetical protein